MPTISYTAMRPDGKIFKAKVEVLSVQALEEELARERLELVEFKEEESSAAAKAVVEASGKEKVSRRELIDFFFQLGTLLKAGVPLIQSLELIANDMPSRQFKAVLRNLAAQVASGATLHEAMGQFPKAFPMVVLALIRVAEKSGSLTQICDELRSYISWLDKLTGEIRQALIYPTLLIIATLLFIFIIFTFVMPKFIKILEEIKVPLPWLTQKMIQLTQLFTGYWHIGLGLLLATIMTLVYLPRYYPRFGIWLDKVKLRMPLFGPVITMLCLSRFGQNLATMYRSGLLILESLQLCKILVGNRALASVMDRIHDGVAGGRKIHEMMKQSGLFPPLVIQMVTTGENTGKLVEALQNMTDYYNDQIPRNIKKIFGILEPTIILTMIVMIGTIALSIFLPITSMLNLNK
jgi:type IV pilus assembly protein PilC